MPRKPVSTVSNGRAESRESLHIQVDKTPFFKQVQAFFADRRTQVICAVILLAFVLFALIAWISYFFTGAQDQSLLSMSHADRVATRSQIANVMGLPGARLAAFFVDGTFGFVSVLILAALALYGLRLMHALRFGPWKLLFCTAFWVIWGSVALGFAQLITGLETFFRWGGAHGEWLSELMTSYVSLSVRRLFCWRYC